MKRILIALLALVFALSFCSKKGGQTSELQKQPLLVKAELMQNGTLSKYFNYKGTVSAWKTANIAPDASGRVGRILKKQGDRVGQGELLAVLDMTALELQQKQARAAMAVARTAYQNAKLNAERMKKMLENKAISQMQYENTQLALDAADTQLKSAAANLDLVDYTLKNAYMKAPFAGVIAAKNMEEGDMINPMMGMGQSILTLMDLSKVKIVVDAPAEEIEKIKIGQRCLVRISSLPGESFSGEVYSKNLAADPLSKTFKVEIKIENPEMKIKAGVYADISIEYIRRENTTLLPLSALLLDDKEVMVNENGLARRRAVTVGLRDDRYFEVLSGLKADEQVLVEGNYDLKDGTAIAVTGDTK
ncbi:MAG: efflux RND transporter periplasmic adaptor subunit [Acidobacteria bacterium]|nr:efflux RND transporter periplasmic adaptor subunit [Acidobacteriota bacterium]MBU4306225.1 efflux RND transporter periplasmic adaptor subunit [Acidobacteriota bacterium]MCG2811850.1 efflux RND transporter periplasmic adaptor subunit [Candidatus Aminicenantes bacterium]